MTALQKRVAIIGRDIHPDGKETAKLIADSLAPKLTKAGIAIDFVDLADIIFDLSSQKITVFDSKRNANLADYDAVLMTNWFSYESVRKDIGHALGLFFLDREIPMLSSEALHARSTSKLSQMLIAAREQVAIPRTIFSLDYAKAVQYARSQDSLALPLIVKDAQASRGQTNFLANSYEELSELHVHHSENTPLIIQSFIESDHSDYRLFMVNGKTKLIIRRIGKSDSHLNNTSAGATTELVEPSQFSVDALRTAEVMAHALHREMTGLDIMFDAKTQTPYFLEANVIPQIATGSNVDEKLEALAAGFVALVRER